MRFKDQSYSVKFPDIAPIRVSSSSSSNSSFSMAAGDFLEIYNEPGL
jgi:hypothetical protein